MLADLLGGYERGGRLERGRSREVGVDLPAKPEPAEQVVGAENGNTLVDAGISDQAETIGAAMADAGMGVGDLGRVIFTHQDLDHIGS